jgi:hypothetical protein
MNANLAVNQGSVPSPRNSFPGTPQSNSLDAPAEQEKGSHEKQLRAATIYGAIIGGAVIFLILTINLLLAEILRRKTDTGKFANGISIVSLTEGSADNHDWPSLELTGVIAGKAAEGACAVINGVVVPLHSDIQGVRVVGLNTRGVVLEYRGSTRNIPIGGTTSEEDGA